MRTVIAAIEDDDQADAVLAAAVVGAEILAATVQAFHVSARDDAAGTTGAAAAAAVRAGVALRVAVGDPVEEIVEAVSHPDVVLAAVGARSALGGRRPAGHVAIAIAERADKPVIVVPPGAAPSASRFRIRRALVPLEGTSETTEAVAAAVHQLAGANVDVVALHVFDDATIPRFWDEPAHAEESFVAEFLCQWCAEPTAHLVVRRGATPSAVVDEAAAEHADVIVLGWKQDLSPGRARVVRTVLGDSRVPVLLVPQSGMVGPIGSD